MSKVKAEEGKVKVRVLTQCGYGNANDVVVITETEAKNAVGLVDADPDAVAYAESLLAAD